MFTGKADYRTPEQRAADAFRIQTENRQMEAYRDANPGQGYGVLTRDAYLAKARAAQLAARAGGGTTTQRVTTNNQQKTTNNNTGNTGGYSTPAYDPAAAAAAKAAEEKAKEDAKRASLRKEGSSYLDTLMKEYDAIIKEIARVGADQTGRLNTEYDGKVQGQVDDMNLGMYDVDASAAASNLADSSFRSFDRGKVRKAADQNISTLNQARDADLGEVGSMVARETAKYKGERDGIGRTRKLLGEEEDVNALQTTVNSLDKTTRGLGAEKARFGTQGEFVTAANKLGNYDTSTLEATLSAVVANSSATPSTKNSTVSDILKGANVDSSTKKKLENKYLQKI